MSTAKITRKDLEIVAFVEKHFFSTVRQVAIEYGIKPQSAREKLNRLVALGLLEKFKKDEKFGSFYIYYITPKAEGLLREQYGYGKGYRIVQRKGEDGNLRRMTLDHCLATTDFYLSLLEESRRRGIPGVRCWWNSRRSHIKIPQTGESYIPDASFLFDNGKQSFICVVEIDRETMNHDRILDKYRKMTLLAESGAWEDQFGVFPRHLELAIHRGWALTIRNYLEEDAANKGYEHLLLGNHFLFSWTADNENEEPFGMNWVRAGNGDRKMSFFAP